MHSVHHKLDGQMDRMEGQTILLFYPSVRLSVRPDRWTDGTVKLLVRPFYLTDHPVCDGWNGRMDDDGDDN